jgi:poly(A) polymerase
MPIITPAYPAMCATHNVMASTQMIITEELKKGGANRLAPSAPAACTHIYIGSELVDKIIVGTADWLELFTKHDFFDKYRYYLQVIASTGNADLQLKW